MRNEKAIIHCCVERDVYELLAEHCERTGQTKTTAVKRAIKAYCGKSDPPSGQPAVQASAPAGSRNA